MTKLIEPAVLQYSLHRYDEGRSKSIVPKAVHTTYNNVRNNGILATIKEAWQSESWSEIATDGRQTYCKNLFLKTDIMTPDTIVKDLIEIGEKADEIQNTQPSSSSDFTFFFHGIRQYLLYKILGPLSDISEIKESTPTSPEEKEKYLFAKKILDHQKLSTDKLDMQIKELNVKQKSGYPIDAIESLQKEIDKTRRELVYVGYIDHLIEPHLRKALFPLKLYPVNDETPIPSFSAMLQRRFVIIFIHEVFKTIKKGDILVGKKDEEIIQIFEEHAIQEMEIIFKKQLDLAEKQRQVEDAKNKMNDAQQKLNKERKLSTSHTLKTISSTSLTPVSITSNTFSGTTASPSPSFSSRSNSSSHSSPMSSSSSSFSSSSASPSFSSSSSSFSSSSSSSSSFSSSSSRSLFSSSLTSEQEENDLHLRIDIPKNNSLETSDAQPSRLKSFFGFTS